MSILTIFLIDRTASEVGTIDRTINTGRVKRGGRKKVGNGTRAFWKSWFHHMRVFLIYFLKPCLTPLSAGIQNKWRAGRCTQMAGMC